MTLAVAVAVLATAAVVVAIVVALIAVPESRAFVDCIASSQSFAPLPVLPPCCSSLTELKLCASFQSLLARSKQVKYDAREALQRVLNSIQALQSWILNLKWFETLLKLVWFL